MRTRASILACACMLSVPLAFGLGGCKKKPSAADEADQPKSVEMAAGMDKKVSMDAMGPVNRDAMDAMGVMKGMDATKNDPRIDVGETPPMDADSRIKPRDGGVAVQKGHKGMLPMKGLVDPTD